MKKAEKIKIAEKICQQYAKAENSFASCCEAEGITDRTFYNWRKAISDISESLKKAKEQRRAVRRKKLSKLALTALELKLQPYDYEEVQTDVRGENGGKLVKKRITKKTILPDTTAIIFTLKNLDPKTWKENLDITSKGEKISTVPAVTIQMPDTDMKKMNGDGDE